MGGARLQMDLDDQWDMLSEFLPSLKSGARAWQPHKPGYLIRTRLARRKRIGMTTSASRSARSMPAR
jgi:hypothetical protein